MTGELTDNSNLLMASLESVLVRMVQLCQTLCEYSQEERQVLVTNNADELASISEKKLNVINEVERLERERHSLTQKVAEQYEIDQEMSLGDMLKLIKHDSTRQLSAVLDRLFAIQADIREVNNGNYVLAMLNLQRLQGIQALIINELNPASSYYGPGTSASITQPPTNWGMDHQV